MCGIGGIFRLPQPITGADQRAFDRMLGALHHRGPEGRGKWVSPRGDVALLHTRLAFVDLSPLGAQPMTTRDGRYSITFNGEIYNDRELRAELEAQGERFASRSDTEVLLRLYALEGARCLHRLDGMFAFAIYDAVTGELFLARDPLGEKPLYYVQGRDFFAFSSEVRALVASGWVEDELDLRGVGLLLRQGSIPPPYTHIKDVRFLGPGETLRLRPTDLRAERRRWYQLPFVADAVADRSVGEATERIELALRESVSRRMRADVPVAAFLSGGIDSSLVCALAVAEGARDLHAFTVTIPNHPDDEAAAAERIARHLGIAWTAITLDVDEKGAWLDAAIGAMDVPSIDGPNTWLVARAVHQTGYKAVFSGLGGDELFMGYDSFRVVPSSSQFARFARPLRHMRGAANLLAQHLPPIPRYGRVADALLSGGSLPAVWLARRGLFSASEIRDVLDEAAFTVAREVDPIARVEALDMPKGLSRERQVSVCELSGYMHDQLLRDTDAMSMAHSLEVRVPLIGLPVVEAVGRTATEVLLGDRPKSVLRSVLAQHLPHELMAQRKKGFVLDWSSLLRLRRDPSDPTLEGLLQPHAFPQERARLAGRAAGYARLFSLHALAGARQRSSDAHARSLPLSAE